MICTIFELLIWFLHAMSYLSTIRHVITSFDFTCRTLPSRLTSRSICVFHPHARFIILLSITFSLSLSLSLSFFLPLFLSIYCVYVCIYPSIGDTLRNRYTYIIYIYIYSPFLFSLPPPSLSISIHLISLSFSLYISVYLYESESVLYCLTIRIGLKVFSMYFFDWPIFLFFFSIFMYNIPPYCFPGFVRFTTSRSINY